MSDVLAAPDAARRPAGQAGGWSGRRTGAVTVLLVVVAVLALRAFVAAPVRVTSSSMEPTLRAGDVVLVDRGISLADVERGDLVTFTSPEDQQETLKRVVGLPGDTVVIRDAVLYVDERPVEESYVDYERVDAYFSRKVTVPPGSVYVLGDNRANSIDSRRYGPVPADALHGRVLARLWPPVRVAR